MRREERMSLASAEEYLGAEIKRGSIDDQLVALIDRHETRLYRFLIALLGNTDAAHDCAQDTFVRAYDNLRKGKPVTAAWLYTVARNRAMDEFRHRRRERPDADALDEFPVGGGIDSVVIRDAFAQLSPDDRTVLYLVAIEGRTPDEAAGLLGISSTAARMRVSRARQRLRLLYGSRP